MNTFLRPQSLPLYSKHSQLSEPVFTISKIIVRNTYQSSRNNISETELGYSQRSTGVIPTQEVPTIETEVEVIEGTDIEALKNDIEIRKARNNLLA